MGWTHPITATASDMIVGRHRVGEAISVDSMITHLECSTAIVLATRFEGWYIIVDTGEEKPREMCLSLKRKNDTNT